MSGKTGFGIGGVLPPPNISRDDMLAAAGDHTKLLQLIEKHTRALADKYAETPVEQPVSIFLTGNAGSIAQKIDFSTQPHNSLQICVFSGTLNLFLGEATNAAQTQVPNYGQYAALTNTQLFLTLRGRIWTVVNPTAGTNLLAFVTPLAL